MAQFTWRKSRWLPLLILFTALITPNAHGLSLSGFQNDLVKLLLDKISVPGQFVVQTQKVEQVSAGSAVLAGLTVSDDKGVWFKAERFVFEWDPSALLKGEARIETLAIENGELSRLPEVPPAPENAPSSGASDAPKGESSTAWPRSPLTLVVGALKITNLVVADGVAPGGLQFDATGSLRDAGEVQSATLVVQRTDAVDGKIEFAYRKQFDTDVLDLRLVAAEAAGGLVARVASLPDNVPVQMTLSASGPPAGLVGQLDLRAETMLSAKGTLEAKWAEKLGIALDLNIVPGKRLDSAMRAVIGRQATLSVLVDEGNDGIAVIRKGRISGPALDARLSGTLVRATGETDIKLTIDADPGGAKRLSQLTSPLAFNGASLNVTLKGKSGQYAIGGTGSLKSPTAIGIDAQSADFAFTAKQRGSSGPLAFTTDLVLRETTGSKGGGASARYEALLGNQLALSLAGSTQGQEIRLTRATIKAQAFQAKASGTVVSTASGVQPDLSYSAVFSDVAALGQALDLSLAGKAKTSGTVTGKSGTARIRGTLNASALMVNQVALGNVRLQHDVRAGSEVNGQIDLTLADGTYGKGNLKAAFAASDRKFALNKLEARLLGLVARGSLSIPTGGAPLGKLDLTINDAAPIGAVLGTKLAGSGKAQLILGANGAGTATLNAELRNVRAADVTMKNAMLKLNLAKVGRPVPQLTDGLLRATEVKRHDLAIAQIELQARGAFDALNVTLNGSGQRGELPIALTSTLRAELAGKRRALGLQTLRIVLDNEVIQLRQPAWVVLTSDGATTDQFALDLPDGGFLGGSARSGATAIEAALDISKLPLRLANVLGIAPVTAGTANGKLRINTGRAKPGMALTLTVADVAMEGAPGELATLRVELDGKWNGKTLSINLQADGPLKTPALATLTLPLVPSEGPVPKVPANGRLKGNATWRGELEPVFALAPAPDHLLSGTAVVDVKLDGPLDDVRVGGEIRIDNGRYENLLLGTIVNNLELRSDFQDARRLRFKVTGDDGVAGNDGELGRLEASGEIESPGVDAQISATVRITSMLLVRLDSATARSSVGITATGDLKRLAVKGYIAVERAEIRLVDAMPPSVVDLGPVRIAGQPIADVNNDSQGAGTRVDLAIVIKLPSAVFVNGRGLNSEWGGQLDVGGTAAKPTVIGRIASRRGQLDFLGRLFELERGAVAFNGARNLDPAIDVRFSRESEDITGQINIVGWASAPEVSFDAVPALPEDEVLPRVLFGRSKTSLSATEALQLAAGLQALSDGRAGVLDSARNALGLDVLRIDSSGDSAALNVGRYVSDKVYVGARQGFNGKPGSVVVEVEVRDNVVLDAAVGQDQRSGVGVTWRKDF